MSNILRDRQPLVTLRKYLKSRDSSIGERSLQINETYTGIYSHTIHSFNRQKISCSPCQLVKLSYACLKHRKYIDRQGRSKQTGVKHTGT